MKCTLFLYTESDNTKGKRLMSYFQGRLGRIAEVRGIKNILVRKQDFRYELRSSQCVVLVGTRQASSLIQNKQQEKDDDTSPSTAKLARRIHRKQRTCREQTCYCSLRWRNRGWLDPDWFLRKANFSCGRRQSSAQRNPYFDSPWISHEENIARRWLLVLSLKTLGSAVKVSSCLNRKVTDAGLAADCIWMTVPLCYILNWSYLFLIAIFPQSKVLSSTVWCLHYWLDCVINLRGWCVIL